MLDPSSLKKSKTIGAHEPIVSQATGMTMWLRERLIVIQFLFQLTVGNLVFYEFLNFYFIQQLCYSQVIDEERRRQIRELASGTNLESREGKQSKKKEKIKNQDLLARLG